MAVFKNTIVTRKGRELISNAITRNKRIVFTKLETSNHVYNDGDDIDNLLSIRNIKQTSPVSNTKRENDNRVVINAIFTNRDLIQGYEIQVIACYAKLENETEILYSLTMAETPDTMPANNGINLSTIEIELITDISNNINVIMQYNPNGMVTKSTLATNTDYGLVTLNQIRGMIPEVDTATTARRGVVQLDSSVNSVLETKAATPKAVKTAYDKGEEALRIANGKQSPATTLAGYGIVNFKVENSTGNLNDFKVDGIYAFNSRTNSENLPVNESGILQVLSGGERNGDYCYQIFKTHYTGKTYERWQISGSNSNWSEWNEVGFTREKLSKILGAEYGGIIQAAGTKTANRIYYDNATRAYYLCKVTNTLTHNDSSKFIGISNKLLLDREINATTELIANVNSGTGSISLTKPLTDFNFVTVVYAPDNRDHIYTKMITKQELLQAFQFSVNNSRASYNLTNNSDIYWCVFARSLKSRRLELNIENCWMYQIYGHKFTLNGLIDNTAVYTPPSNSVTSSSSSGGHNSGRDYGSRTRDRD